MLSAVGVVAFVCASLGFTAPSQSSTGTVTLHAEGTSVEEVGDPSTAGGQVIDPDTDISPASLLAGEMGISVSAAGTLLAKQDQFGDLVAAFRLELPESFAEAWVADETENVFAAAFVGEVPGRAVQLAEESGLQVDLVGDAPTSEQEIEALQQEVDSALYDSIGPVFASSADARTGVVSVVLPALLQRTPEELPVIIQRDDVALQYSEGAVYVPQVVQGGAFLIDEPSNEGCTSGFSVANSEHVGGIVTAGHCGDENTGGFMDFYVHPGPDADRTNLNFRARYASGVYGDVEWYSTPVVERASIYHTNTDTRTIEAVVRVDTFYTNRVFEFFGRGSDDYNWARVLDASVTCGRYGHLVKMNKNFTTFGDSGGPWFSNHKAAGIHSGSCGPAGELKSVFSKAGRLPRMLGVHVRTQ